MRRSQALKAARYANRIRNGTFTIPVTKNASGPNKFQIPKNENNGEQIECDIFNVLRPHCDAAGTNTLHGGDIGYDRRVWSVLLQTESQVTFGLVDPDGEQGFPGTVLTAVRGLFC